MPLRPNTSLVITIVDDHNVAVVRRGGLRPGRSRFHCVRVKSGRGTKRRGGTTGLSIATAKKVAPAQAPNEGGCILIDGPDVLVPCWAAKEPGHKIVLRAVWLADQRTRRILAARTLRVGASRMACPSRSPGVNGGEAFLGGVPGSFNEDSN